MKNKQKYFQFQKFIQVLIFLGFIIFLSNANGQKLENIQINPVPKLINNAFTVDVARQQTNVAIVGVFVTYAEPKTNIGLDLGGGLFYDTRKNLYLNLQLFIDADKQVLVGKSLVGQNTRTKVDENMLPKKLIDSYIASQDTVKYIKNGKVKRWLYITDKLATVSKKNGVKNYDISNKNEFQFLNLKVKKHGSKTALGRKYVVWHESINSTTHINQIFLGKEYSYFKIIYSQNTIVIQKKNRIIRTIQFADNQVIVYRGDVGKRFQNFSLKNISKISLL